MDKKEKYFKIARLIADELGGSISSMDKSLLENWLSESIENLEIYNEIKKDSWYAENLNNQNKYSPDEAWDKIKTRITASPKIRLMLVSISKYAAAILLLFSIVFFGRDFFNKNVADLEVVQPLIKPGIKAAELSMDDGTIVSLSTKNNLVFKEKYWTIINNTPGVVQYIRSDKEAQKEFFNTIKTSTGEEFTIILSDGTKVILNAESEIKFPVVFVKENRMVEVKGEAYFEVAHNTEHPFIVNTPKSTVQVLGTSFNIRAYDDEETNVTTLVEGKVKISHKFDKNSFINLNPGEQAFITIINTEIEVEQVNTEYSTAWKDGKFIFRNERLEDIIKDLGRWYHFEAEYKNEKVKDIRFGARIDRYNEVNPIFNIMNNTRLVKISQDKNKFIIDVNE